MAVLDPLALNETNAGTRMQRLAVFGTGEPNDLAWSPDGKTFAVATARGVWLYDGTTLEDAGFIDVNDEVTALAFSPDGAILALAVLACGGTQGDIGRQRIRGKQNVVRNFASKSSCQSVGRFDKSWSSHPLFRCANLTNAATSIIIATLPSPMIVAPETPATLR